MMMAKKNLFQNGTTWQQVRDEFDRLEAVGLRGADDVVQTLDHMALNGDPNIELEEEVLGVFRARLRSVLSGEVEETDEDE